MKTVIIGNSVAGIAAAQGFRSVDRESELIIVSSEPYRTYSRPLISYYLAGKVTEEKMYYRPADFYEKRNIKTLFGKTVTRIDTNSRRLDFADGDTLDFDRLLIATGGVPFVPPIKGLEDKKYFTFTTWDDAKKVQELIPNVGNATVLGGGLIGLKVAEALNKLHVKTTIVELAQKILSPALDNRAAALMREALEEAGIDVRTGDTIEKVEGTGDAVRSVTLRSGETLPCDLLIVAVGVVPNTSFTDGSGIETNRGILIDDHMQTNIEGIYAAGDVAEGHDVLLNSKRVIPIWPSAYTQGFTAGQNMAGADVVTKGTFAMNSVDVNGTSMISVGLSTVEQDDADYEVLTADNNRTKEYRKIVLQDDQIVGAVFVNAIDRAGIVTGLIRDSVNVKNFKDSLCSNDFGYISLPKQLRKSRLETLGAKQ